MTSADRSAIARSSSLERLEVRTLLSGAPTAAFLPTYVEGTGGSRTFAVLYTGPDAVYAASLGNDDVVVTGPGGHSAAAKFVGVVPDSIDGGTVAQYRVDGIVGGAYTAALRTGAVYDAHGSLVPGGLLGGFRVGRHGHTVPRGPEGLPLAPSLVAVGTVFGSNAAPPVIDTAFGAVAQAINFGGPATDLTGSTGANVHFDRLIAADPSATPARLQSSPFSVTLDSAVGNDLYNANTGGNLVYESEIFAAGQETETLTIAGLDPARSYRFQFLHGDTRIGSLGYSSTPQTLTLSNGQTTTTPLEFATRSDNADSDTIVDVAGTTSLRYAMPRGLPRGPSVSAVVIEVALGPVSPPLAARFMPAATAGKGSTRTFEVVYGAAAGIDRKTLDSHDLLVTGPGGFSAVASLVRTGGRKHGQSRTATYQVHGITTGGRYSLSLLTKSVTDAQGQPVPAAALGYLRIGAHGHTWPWAL